MRRSYQCAVDVRSDEVRFALSSDSKGKTTIILTYGATMSDLSMVSPAAVSLWPRVTGDGNYGTMWGPSDITKAKYSIDLCDLAINNEANTGFEAFKAMMDGIDNKLLDFVHQNQLRVLGRKNLSIDEVKMLQIRSVRPKYDKNTGNMTGHAINLSTTKYAWDGMGGKYERKINVCDHEGNVIKNGIVCPGDVVAATMYANQVYTGVGGDKFGIHWSFEDVQVLCQRHKLEDRTEVQAFAKHTYPFASEYVLPGASVADQFADAEFPGNM